MARRHTAGTLDSVHIGDMADDAYPKVVTPVQWQTIMDVRLDDAPTAQNSDSVDCRGWSGLWVSLFIDSTLAPTRVRFIAQTLIEGDWHDFEEGFWAALYYEDQDTADGVYKVFKLPVGGLDVVRIRAVATGTDATNYFDIVVKVRAFRGSTSDAHA